MASGWVSRTAIAVMTGCGRLARMADLSVRPAVLADVGAIADLQLRTWQTACAGIVPASALASLSDVQAQAHWQEAIAQPPSAAHRVLVATADDLSVGFAAVGPDSDGSRAGEVYLLLVDIGAQRVGHGSRLLASCVEHLRRHDYARAVTWLFERARAARTFYEGAGWAADGGRRELDMGEAVAQVRLHTDLG